MVKPVKNAAKAAEVKPEASKAPAKKGNGGGPKKPAAPAKKAPGKKKAGPVASEAQAEADTSTEQDAEATGSLGRKDIAAALREKVHESGAALPEKLAETVIKGFEQVVEEAVAKGLEINLPGFGKFAVKHRPARTGRNPSDGSEVAIAASYVPVFKPGKALKDAANTRDASAA